MGCNVYVKCEGGMQRLCKMWGYDAISFSLQEAVRLLVMGKSLVTPDDEMFNYNYTGQQFNN